MLTKLDQRSLQFVPGVISYRLGLPGGPWPVERARPGEAKGPGRIPGRVHDASDQKLALRDATATNSRQTDG
jgi:hypothetical protein